MDLSSTSVRNFIGNNLNKLRIRFFPEPPEKSSAGQLLVVSPVKHGTEKLAKTKVKKGKARAKDKK